jgi:hypothetical protein
MSAKPFLRDLTLLAAAAAIGWWAHGATTVQAHSDTHASSDPALSFEFGGTGPDGQVTLYNAANHMMYVYPSIARSSSANVPCLYMVHVERAGMPLERQNCVAAPVGH